MPAAPFDPPSSPGESITIHTTDETITVCVHGVLDRTSAPLLEHCLAAVRAADMAGPHRLVLEVHALTGCDGAGLRAVLTAVERAERDGIALHIDGLDGVAGRVLAGSHLRTGFDGPAGRARRPPHRTPRAPGVPGRHRPTPR
ncbi:STAS domain-containing protein [Planobispora takensis]|uniref:STAS domain-containing protein n=1 Tax=Planobispora takensis TaxID=1367882 RepID=A0A8J3WW56_9ACTN|nr:STAS domain-containing protein [Planobispora takensis]GII04496.1 hypothetical protein Pta02_65040 [Planobispora takensis]